jgi:putative MATE family efflux protein
VSVSRPAPRLITGPVGRHLVGLAVPMAIGFVALNSYSIVDTYFVGQLGTLPLAALGFTFPVAFSMVAVGLGVGVGVSSVLARLLGTGKQELLQRITTHSLLLSALLGALLALIGLWTIDPVFRMLGADARTLPLIREYMEIFYLGGIFLILPMVGNFAIRAVGDARVPAYLLVISALVNILLDPLLIFGMFGLPRLELRGAAIATVIANAVTFLASLAVLHRREHLIRLRFVGRSQLWDSARQVLHVGIPATASHLLNPVSIGIITAIVASYGPAAVAGFGVASRVESVVAMAIFALASSLGPFVGQNFGANRFDRIRAAVRVSDRFCLVYGLGAAALLLALGGPVAALFNGDAGVIGAARTYLSIVPITYAGFGATIVAAASFNALGRPLPAISIMAGKMFVLYVPLAWMLSGPFGLPGIFSAAAIAHLSFGLVSVAWLRRMLNGLAGARLGDEALDSG